MKRAVFDSRDYVKGDFVMVEVTDASQNTLYCTPIKHIGVQEFFSL
jgi:hypothetical protein